MRMIQLTDVSCPAPDQGLDLSKVHSESVEARSDPQKRRRQSAEIAMLNVRYGGDKAGEPVEFADRRSGLASVASARVIG